MLEINDIHISYGKVEVIKGVSLRVDQGEVVVIIGANGAGKSTILKTITGLIRPTSGQVIFGENEISSKKVAPEKIVGMGLAMCPEGRQVFPQHTVYQNLILGGYIIRHNNALVQERVQEMYNMFPILEKRSTQLAGTLSGGEQQMLAIARAMMSGPKLLLLDEPSAGLAPVYVKAVFDMIERLAKAGTTILLVEQMANMALEIANRAYVLETGKITINGTGEQLRNDPRIIESYLGSKR